MLYVAPVSNVKGKKVLELNACDGRQTSNVTVKRWLWDGRCSEEK